MSLINQALRKAQQQRTPSRPATAADHASASHPNYTGNFNKSGLLIGLVAGIALLIGLVAGLTIVVLRKDPAPVAQQAATLPAPAKQIAPATPVIQPLAVPTQPLEQDSPSVLNDLRIARVAAEAKAAADATSAKQVEAAKQLAATKAAAKPSQDIIQWLGKSKISGVRLSTSGNKVILNNNAYLVGETVNVGLGLKVLIIQEKRVLFIDPNGKKYLKQL
jgi:hypothetical protein